MPPLAPTLLQWYAGNARILPWRQDGFSAWGVLVSEFMLQQTPVNRVIPHLEAWLERWPTPSALADQPASEALTQWANLGYPRRALWLHRAAVEIRDRFGGRVPSDVEELLSLTGIGDYTARAVAVFAYGQRQPVVDINTRRVIARAQHGSSQPGPASPRDLAEMDAQLPVDAHDAAAFNAATMELGALICTARNPRCEACPISDQCQWLAAGRPDTGDKRRRQATYEGSDRQARGAVMRTLRHAPDNALLRDSIVPDWPDADQR